MTTRPTDTLSLTSSQRIALRWLAQQCGLTIGRGPKASEGSIRQIVTALAAGQALFVPLPGGGANSQAAARLRDLAVANPDIADLLGRVATGIEQAGKMHSTL